MEEEQLQGLEQQLEQEQPQELEQAYDKKNMELLV